MEELERVHYVCVGKGRAARFLLCAFYAIFVSFFVLAVQCMRHLFPCWVGYLEHQPTERVSICRGHSSMSAVSFRRLPVFL